MTQDRPTSRRRVLLLLATLLATLLAVAVVVAGVVIGQRDRTGTVTGNGDGSAVFVVDDGRRDGIIGVTWSVVVRSGSTLLHVGYTTEQQIGTGAGPGEGGDDAAGNSPVARSTAESLARAALDRFTAQT
jgi:hypothetical protein